MQGESQGMTVSKWEDAQGVMVSVIPRAPESWDRDKEQGAGRWDVGEAPAQAAGWSVRGTAPVPWISLLPARLCIPPAQPRNSRSFFTQIHAWDDPWGQYYQPPGKAALLSSINKELPHSSPGCWRLFLPEVFSASLALILFLRVIHLEQWMFSGVPRSDHCSPWPYNLQLCKCLNGTWLSPHSRTGLDPRAVLDYESSGLPGKPLLLFVEQWDFFLPFCQVQAYRPLTIACKKTPAPPVRSKSLDLFCFPFFPSFPKLPLLQGRALLFSLLLICPYSSFTRLFRCIPLKPAEI